MPIDLNDLAAKPSQSSLWFDFANVAQGPLNCHSKIGLTLPVSLWVPLIVILTTSEPFFSNRSALGCPGLSEVSRLVPALRQGAWQKLY